MHDTSRHLGKCLRVGDTFFRRFQIQEIREGGMGTVYIARDPSVDPTHPESKFLQETSLFHTCAVKTFQDRFFDTPAVMERFVRESVSWVELPRHERVVFAHYINVIDGRPYLFLEYVEGPSLRHWINDSRHPPAEATALAWQLCEGMTHIHEIGKLVHRDLKPENVLMCGNADLKITDLGIAKAIDALSESSEGRQTGDPRYMAPEQFHSESSALSDIYTFGVVFYEMLTGRRPSLLRDMSLPERPDQINREVPPELSEIVLRCLARNPRERYGSFFAIKDDISKVLKVHFPGALSRPTVEPTNMWEIMLFQEREYRALTKDRGPDPYTNYLLGHSLACVGQYGDALKYVERMAHPDDGSSEAGRSLVLAGNCLNALGEFRPALRAFEDSLVTTVFGDRQQNSYIQLKPGQTIEGPNRGRDLPFVWAGMAYSWLRLGNRKQALECLRRGASLDQLRAETWPTIWNPLVDSPEFEQAIRRDLKEVPELRMLWFEVKASVLLALGRCDEAIRSYTVVLGVNSRHSRAWMRLADARLGTGDQAGADEAVAAAKKAGERPPIRPVLYTGLAGLLQKVWGRLALKAYDCALSIDPRCSGAWNNKGYFLKRLGMHEQAIHCYRQAVASDPLNWVAWGNLGSVLGIVGRYRESLECSKRSLGINPFNDSAIANKRHALLLLGPQP